MPPVLGHRDAKHRVEHPPCGTSAGADGCGQADDHPRHIIAEADGTTTVKHMDCCNCVACVVTLDHAGGARGVELAEHIQKHGSEIAKQVERLMPAPDKES